MPTYQYACTNPDCANRFELVQSFSDPAATECPVCGGPVRKVFSSVGVVFKGSGFYRTDSRAGSSNGSANGSAKESTGDSAATKDSSSTSSSSSMPASSGTSSGSSSSTPSAAAS